MDKAFRIALFLGMIILFSGIANAQMIKEYDLSISIIDSTALVSQSIKTDFANTISLKLPEDARITDISVENYTFKGGILEAKTDGEFRLKYLTREIIEKADNYYLVQRTPFPFDTEDFKMKVILPESAVLDTPESAYPSPKITSNGVNIILEWEKSGLKKGESFAVFVIFRKISSYNWIAIASIIIIMIAVSFMVLRSLRLRKVGKPKGKIRKKTEPGELHLLESESAVMNALKKLGGEGWQKQLQIQTGFSKAKLSRVIRDLEARKLIRKIPLGNTNKIKSI